MGAVLSLLSSFIGPIMKMLPFLAAFKVGQGKAEKDVLENNAEARTRSDKAVNEVKQEVRDKGLADTVRNRQI